MMTEEINYSYEGGLYGQLLRNATFREDKHGRRPNPWTPWKSGGAKYWTATDTTRSVLTLTQKGGYSRALPACLNWKAQAGASLANDGYWGIAVRPVNITRGISLHAPHKAAR